MMKSIATVAGLAAAVSAFTQPVQPPTYGSLLTPDLGNPLIAGQSFDITWTPKQPSAGVTVSLVLCKGPSTNCVLQDTAIVEGIPASAAKYTWSVPCSLSEGVQNTATGYGMLVIVDGTGEFQYSTQFSVQKAASCSSSSSTSRSVAPTTSVVSTSVTSRGSASTTPNPPYTDAGSSWIKWTSSSTTLNSTISATPTAVSSSKYTFSSVATTSAIVTSTRPSTTPAAATTTAAATSPRASTFTGAAAAPTAFAKAFGVVGAAVLAGFAL